MDDLLDYDSVSEGTEPEPLSIRPPAPQEMPPSIQDVLFDNDEPESLASLPTAEELEPLPLNHTTDYASPPPAEIVMPKKRQGEESDTFYEDRSLEAKVVRTLRQGPVTVTAKKSTQDVSREIKLERTLEHTRVNLKAANERLFELENENSILKRQGGDDQQQYNDQEAQAEMDRLKVTVADLSNTNKQLAQEKAVLAETNKTLNEEKEKIISLWQIAERDAKLAQEECARMRKDLEISQNDKTGLEEQLNDLKIHARNLEAKVVNVQANDDAAELSKINLDLQNTLNAVNKENVSLQNQVQDLSNSLENKSKEYSALMSKKSQLEERLKKTPMSEVSVPAASNDLSSLLKRRPLETPRPVSYGLPDDDSTFAPGALMSDRLTRIRESTERAALTREHQLAISRLVAEHEAKISAMTEYYEEEKSRLVEEAREELNARVKELKRRLVSDYERKIEELERRHKKEMQRSKEESERCAATAKESVESAMAEVASRLQDYEREARKRNLVEIQLKEQAQDHNAEKEQLIRSFQEKLDATLVGCEDSKAKLLAEVQRDCNAVFDRSKSSSTSKLAMPGRAFALSATPASRQVVSPIAPKQNAVASSPASLSELNQSLLETEAFVQQILGHGAGA